jgi:hypothetical protein
VGIRAKTTNSVTIYAQITRVPAQANPGNAASLPDSFINKIAVDKRYIETDDNDNIETITNKLITTLLYKSNRHNWNGSLCSEIRKFIGDLKPDFAMQEKGLHCKKEST